MGILSLQKNIPQLLVVSLGLYAIGVSSPTLASTDLFDSLTKTQASAQIEQLLSNEDILLTPEAFVHLALLRNPDVLLTAEQRAISEQQVVHHRGAYEAEFFANINASNRYTRNSDFAEEDETIERNRRIELGVRKLLRSGAEISFDYEGVDRFNNTLSTMDPDGLDDSLGGLNLLIRQPLLQGRGSLQVEKRIEQAQVQLLIAKQEIEQQILTKTFEALSHYWRLYRDERLVRLSHESYEYANRILEDTQRLVDVGRMPETALIEARSILLLRESQLSQAIHSYNRTLSAIQTFLNLSALDGQSFSFITHLPLSRSKLPLPNDFNRYFDEVLSVWPNYQIVKNRIDIEEKNLVMAKDELKPSLDLVMSYGHSSRRFDKNYERSFEDALASHYPNWSVGLEFSMPISGNQRAKSKQAIAHSRIKQSQIQADAARVDLANQLHIRFDQVDKAFDELDMHIKNTQMLKSLLDIENARYESGLSRLMDVIEREDKLNMGVVREVNAQISYELAKVSIQLYDGSLLKSVQVDLDMGVINQAGLEQIDFGQLSKDNAQVAANSMSDAALEEVTTHQPSYVPVNEVLKEAKTCHLSQAECLKGTGYWLQLGIFPVTQKDDFERYLQTADINFVAFNYEYKGRNALSYTTGPFSDEMDPVLIEIKQRLEQKTPIRDAYVIFHGLN